MTAEIILLAKKERFSQDARAIAEAIFGDRLATFLGTVGDPLPEEVANGRPAFLLSFLSPWIVPGPVLERAGTSINFHPASIDYPGIGCYNFALYDDAAEFGAVCHHMLAKVDTGAVIEERRFPLFASDTVETLKLRTMVTMVSMFHDICCGIASGQKLPASASHWSRRPYTRRDMNALREIRADMPDEEIRRRVRAMTYPGYPGPSVTLAGHVFHAPVPDRPPLA
ncbi:MAG TPA: formyltransferase family protein [Allosphingosinicella sp.]|jgi:methionyl-tRNA formyltransferase